MLGMRQLRLAENARYAHAAFFLNAGSAAAFPGENRILFPPVKARTYELQPEMNTLEVKDHPLDAIICGEYDVIIRNYANCGVVGRAGKIPVAKLAVEAVDNPLQRVVDALISVHGQRMLTADHGNIKHGQPHSSHTTNRIPLVYVCGDKPLAFDGGFSDLAPTLPAILGIEQPAEITGKSLIIAA